MARFAYIATGPDGQLTAGTEKADSKAAAELALYERELRDIRVSEKKSFLKTEISAPRVKRDEVMHLSRQLSATLGRKLRRSDGFARCPARTGVFGGRRNAFLPRWRVPRL